MLDNKRLNELESKLKEKIYELISIFYEDSSKELLGVDDEIRGFIKGMYTNVEHFKENPEFIDVGVTRIEDNFETVIRNIERNFEEFKVKRKESFTKYVTTMSNLAKSKRELGLVQFRCINIVKNHEYMFRLFVSDFMDELRDVYFRNFADLKNISIQYLDFLEMVNNNNYEEENLQSIVYDIFEENDFYISKSDSFDYKEMCKLAENNGFVYKWSNGSHRIYEHKETHKGMVIPSHTLGFGLSKVIQKQIKNKSIENIGGLDAR